MKAAINDLRAILSSWLILMAVRVAPRDEEHDRLCELIADYYEWTLKQPKYNKYREK